MGSRCLLALRQFADGARTLERMAFFDRLPKTSTWNASEKGFTATMDVEPDDEALRAALMELRQLYSPKEPHNFGYTVNTLKRHVRERGSVNSEARSALKRLKAGRRWALNGIGMGIVIETPTQRHEASPEAILDAYFNGRYFHRDAEKAWLAERLDELAPWGRYTFYTVLGRLKAVYSTAADVVEHVLGEPSLLSAGRR
jgi:hypothetical protein